MLRSLTALLLLTIGCSNAWTRRAPEPSNDEVAASALTSAVSHALFRADIDGRERVQIEVQGDTVTLSGSLASPEAAARAVEAAGRVEGVARVVDRVEIAAR